MSGTKKKIGVVIANLGTPAKPTTIAVYRYLAQFLSDKRVIDLPAIFWKPLLYGVILPLRSPKVAKLYQDIWTGKGSPLRYLTQSISDKLNVQFEHYQGANITCVSAMSYGKPSIDDEISKLLGQGIEDIVVLPLYPQYSATTTAVVLDKMSALFAKTRHIPQVRTIMQYCDNELFIDALTDSIRTHWQQYGQAEKLVLSFHGMPQRYVDAGDPYQKQCQRTAHAVVKQLGLNDDQWLITYQSRFGKAQWLTPYTDLTLKDLASNGTQSVDIICPAFAVDCLETIEEIEQQNRDVFIGAGGRKYNYIKALNDSDQHIAALKSLIEQQLHAM
ncbi:MAG: ferrochelatase [Psychrobium sp.]|nr:ferrochelatase [Psychrobium sp.]